MKAVLLAVAAASLLAACEDKSAVLSARVARLEADVAYLKETRTAPAAVAAVEREPAKSGAELVVTWPEKGGNDYRRLYGTMAACSAARQAIADDYAKRLAESQAGVGTRTAEGVLLLGSPRPPEPSAVCLPT